VRWAGDGGTARGSVHHATGWQEKKGASAGEGGERHQCTAEKMVGNVERKGEREREKGVKGWARGPGTVNGLTEQAWCIKEGFEGSSFTGSNCKRKAEIHATRAGLCSIRLLG
jgi:hypothetical protein